MIKFNEDCVSCKHKKVCKHVNKPKELKDKLKDTKYDDMMTWEDIVNSCEIDITFSCPNFMGGGIR